ncbi:hypothetical protein C8F04DRAFT_309263 [Mycena alexandri]|uniref:Uncharacterized protein n=1 Tax=Mycena alexandri TaxID=1745969 RepID=A0AAD6S3E3_9AGAR|nr:hypothetical protein C8F04DRAFT_309263 [Mycena alexandri]
MSTRGKAARGRGRPKKTEPQLEEQDSPLTQEDDENVDVEGRAAGEHDAQQFLDNLDLQAPVEFDSDHAISPPRHDPNGSSDNGGEQDEEDEELDENGEEDEDAFDQRESSMAVDENRDVDMDPSSPIQAPPQRKPRPAPPARAPSERIAQAATKAKEPTTKKVAPAKQKAAAKGKKNQRGPPSPATPIRPKKRQRASTLQQFHETTPDISLVEAEAAVLNAAPKRGRKVSFSDEVHMHSPPQRGEAAFDDEFPAVQSSPRGPHQHIVESDAFQKLVDSEVAKKLAALTQGKLSSYFITTVRAVRLAGAPSAPMATSSSTRGSTRTFSPRAPHLRWALPSGGGLSASPSFAMLSARRCVGTNRLSAGVMGVRGGGSSVPLRSAAVFNAQIPRNRLRRAMSSTRVTHSAADQGCAGVGEGPVSRMPGIPAAPKQVAYRHDLSSQVVLDPNDTITTVEHRNQHL